MEDNKIILTTLSPKTHRTSEENLGIGYLKSSLTKKGYDVIIIDGWLNELTVEEVYEKIIKIDNVLFIGISTYMSNTQHTIDLIKMLKEKNKEYKILCGGFGPTFYPDEYLKNGADFVIRGEGEQVICKLADSLKYKQDQSDILSLSYIKNNNIIHNEMAPLVENLDIFPFPARDTLDVVINKKSTVNIVTSRGCSGNCDFCSVISFFRLSKGKVWRTRSIKNIVDEIEQLYKKGVTFIKVVDDSFIDGNRDEAWCKEFADEIEKRNIKVKLRGQIRADKVTDQILFHLKRAGFFSFACGIENGSETALKRMNKKSTLIENKKALELFKKHGYIVQMGYILFDKNTSLDELKDNYLFLNEYDFTVTKGIFSEMFSAQGTKLNNKLRVSGNLIESDFINNNNKYTIDDDKVKIVYNCLKKWHKSHSKIYDMTIDPLSAPKNIDDLSIKELYNCAMELKKEDLLIFKFILTKIELNEYENLDKILDDIIEKRQYFYDEKSKEVQKIYVKNKLNYNADENPFI